MTNTENMKKLIGLYKDSCFKAQFISTYVDKGIHLHIAEKEYSNAFEMIYNSTGTEANPAPSSASITSLKEVLLSIAAYGLSFDVNEKDVYLSGIKKPSGGTSPYAIIGYRGMRKIAMNSGKVSLISSEIVYKDDSFTWLGTDKIPSFASTGRNTSKEVLCGFVVMRMTDGSIQSFRMSGDELKSIEANDIQTHKDLHGHAEDSLYTGAWREKCLRISLWRAAYRENQHLFTSNLAKPIAADGSIELQGEVAPTGFEKLLESQLNSEAVA